MHRSSDAKLAFLENAEQVRIFSRACEVVLDCYRNGNRLYIAGNGGSAADSQHLAAEFVSKLANDRSPLPAEALTVDSSVITAIANDYGYEHVFSRQLEGKAQDGDVFLGITTSGNSANILRAVELCTQKSIETVVFSGRDGGHIRRLVKNTVVVNNDRTSTIQELHIVLAHSLCEYVEGRIFFE